MSDIPSPFAILLELRKRKRDEELADSTVLAPCRKRIWNHIIGGPCSVPETANALEWYLLVAPVHQSSMLQLTNISAPHDVFTLIIGEEGETIQAPRHILNKASIFKTMCDGPFQESATKTIELRHDDAATIKALLQCLGLEDDGNKLPQWLRWDSDAVYVADLPEALAALFIAADKYGLLDVHEAIASTLDDYAHATDAFLHDVPRLLAIVEAVYGNVPSTKNAFRRWFREYVPTVMAHPEARGALQNYVLDRRGSEEGDEVVVDVLVAQAEALALYQDACHRTYVAAIFYKHL